MPTRNYDDRVQHAAFRRTFDPPYTAAHDALDDAYYGQEDAVTGRRSGGWRDGGGRTLQIGHVGWRLATGVMERTEDDGKTWAQTALSPQDVFRGLERFIHQSYAHAYRQQFTLVGADRAAVVALGIDDDNLASVVAQVKTNPMAAFADLEDASAGRGAKTIGDLTLSSSAGGIDVRVKGGDVVRGGGSRGEQKALLVRLLKYARDRARWDDEPDLTEELAALTADGFALPITSGETGAEIAEVQTPER